MPKRKEEETDERLDCSTVRSVDEPVTAFGRSLRHYQSIISAMNLGVGRMNVFSSSDYILTSRMTTDGEPAKNLGPTARTALSQRIAEALVKHLPDNLSDHRDELKMRMAEHFWAALKEDKTVAYAKPVALSAISKLAHLLDANFLELYCLFDFSENTEEIRAALAPILQRAREGSSKKTNSPTSKR